MNQHVPVLADEVLEQLQLRPNGNYVDCSFGRGGHSRAILSRLGADGHLLAMDRDPSAVAAADQLVAEDERLTVEQACFSELAKVLQRCWKGRRVDGILADLGVSSPQLDDAERGFSFSHDGPLDMRMDPSGGTNAAEWLSVADEGDIARVLRRLGEEKAARRIAGAICRYRETRPIRSTQQLAKIIETVVPRKFGAKHPATRSFQAIRLYINREIEELESLLEQSLEILGSGGRLVVISFHSLEDRRVKRFFRDHSRVDPALADLPVIPESAQPRLRAPGKPIRPNAEEIATNPRARSATLRVGEWL